MPNTPQLLSIIIPVFNEQATIAEVVERVTAVDLPLEKEIIVVDDGSTDGTADILNSIRGKVKEIHLGQKNIGKGFAVRTGLALVSGDIILIQDADLELDPNEYDLLIRPILEGNTDVVYGSRFLRENRIPVMRWFANVVLTRLTNLLFRTQLTDMGTAYKVFRREVAQAMVLTSNRFDIDPEITCEIVRAGYKICEVPISYMPRTRLEGKKIKWYDGFRAIWTLVRCRLRRHRVKKD